LAQFKVALLQMDIRRGDYETNYDKVKALLDTLEEDIDIILLPEMWSVGFDFKNMKEHGERVEEVIVDMSNLAQEHKAMLIGGSIPQTIGSHLFNTLFVINQDGSIQDQYWKMHLVSENNLEATVFDRGDRVSRFKIKDVVFGVVNCYDIRFPEVFRGAAFNGAKMIFMVAQFPYPLYQHWITLLMARAIENQVYIVAVNRAGKSFFGHSVVIGPTGEVQFEADDKEGIHVVAIDTSLVDAYRDFRNDIMAINPAAYSKWVYPSNFIGVGGLVDRDKKILMVKQNYGKMKGMWMLPGGHLDQGESPDKGVIREVHEETKVTAEAGGIIAIKSQQLEKVTDVYIVFMMRYISGEPTSDGFENTEAEFLAWEEIHAQKDIISPLAYEIVEKYFHGGYSIIPNIRTINNEGKRINVYL